MIKYINRIIYALLAALGLMLVFNLSESYVISNFLIAEGEKALEENRMEFFMPSRYYFETPIQNFEFSEDGYTFQILIYEVARIQIVDDEYVVSDGIFFLMNQLAGEDLANIFEVEYLNDETIINTYVGSKQFTLPLYTTYQKSDKRTILLKDDFLVDNDYLDLTSVKIYQGEELKFTIPVSVDFDTFTIKTQIENYLVTNDDTPKDPFGTVAITPYVEYEDTNHVIVRNIIIYFVSISLITVLLFKYKNKQLGRKKATQGLKQDIEKLHKKED